MDCGPWVLPELGPWSAPEAGQNQKGPMGLPDILKGMKIFSLVSGCRIAWQEQGTRHRVTVGRGGEWTGGQEREERGKGELPKDWPVSPFPPFKAREHQNMGPQQDFP